MSVPDICVRARWRKEEEGGDAVASLTDDNAALAQRASVEFTVIWAPLY